MKVLRITLSAVEVLRQDEKEFRKEFTQRMIDKGFDLGDPIIKQKRSDIEGMDIIQLRYRFFDKFDADIQFFRNRIKEKTIGWFKHNFLKQEDEEEIEEKNTRKNKVG